jgi:tetratricopeptide (TPR) repeat protein
MPWSRVRPAERRDTGTAPAGPPDRRDPRERERDEEASRRDEDARYRDDDRGRRDPHRPDEHPHRDDDRAYTDDRAYRDDRRRDAEPREREWDERYDRYDPDRRQHERREQERRDQERREYERREYERQEHERRERERAYERREPDRREPDRRDYERREDYDRREQPDRRDDHGRREDRRDEYERRDDYGRREEQERREAYERREPEPRYGYDRTPEGYRAPEDYRGPEEDYRPRRAAPDEAEHAPWTEPVHATATVGSPVVDVEVVPDPAPVAYEPEPPGVVYQAEVAGEPEPEPLHVEYQPAPDITDPESALAGTRIDYDPQTLHEQPENVYEIYRIRDSLTARIDSATDNPSRARLLGVRSVVNRIVGDLRQSQADGKLALVHAEATGQLRRIAVAQARLANVLVRLGELDEADRLFTEANSPELPERLRAAIHHYAGKCAFEQDRYIEACQHFEKALELRRDGDPELVAATEVALDALFSRVADRGWGPYPRSRDEILQTHRPPMPTFDEQYDRWGFSDGDGHWPIGPQFADVQPFRDGVAWVRPVGIETWGLIDETGRLLIDPRRGFLGVGSYSDGLAWVSPDGLGGWFAIDKSARVVINAGFDDVRPFRRGIAIVRQRGKWGAVESNGRLAVQFAFDAFSTGLADGRYVEGFTDEGLAIVEVGGRKGVIDRTGRVLVPLAYPTVVIHPVAFLFTDANQRWGAIARNGQPLVNPVHPSRKSLTDELEQLLADTRPIL